MGYLRGFIPWIVFGAVSASNLRWGALAGLLTAVVMLRADLRRGATLDSQVLEISSIAFFAAVTAFAFAFPTSSMKNYIGAISLGWLAVTALGSLTIGRPFTLGIARRQTPREYWDAPGFIEVNNAITAAWGAGFTFICIVLIISDVITMPSWVTIGAHVLGLAAPMVFTKVYPARVQARMLANASA